jgi:hypothetical protein
VSHFLLFLLVSAGTTLFFLDMDHGSGSALYQLYGFAHLAFFMFTAMWLSRLPAVSRRPFPAQFFLVMVMVFSLGGIIELTQPYFGRSASWRDLLIDLMGGFLGMVFLAPGCRSLGPRVLVSMRVAVLALTGVMFYGPLTTLWDMGQASRHFPVFSDFETPFEAGRWSSGKIQGGLARHGDKSLRVALRKRKYAGTMLKRDFGGWRGYSTFAFSLYNPDPDPLPITVSIRDREHFGRGGEYSDWFNRVFTMEQGWNDVFIPVADIENAPSSRRLDLSRLKGVVIFTENPPAPRVIYLDYVRLIR